jgi:DNA-binding response OmpR family regulator
MAAKKRAPDAATILVVDDDHDICDMIAEALALDGHRVLTASNGQMALEQARRDRPDLIVLDLMMPGMSGWEFLEAQREDPDLASVPVIVDTACPQTRVDGAAVILQKPFDVDTLLATVAWLHAGGRGHHVSVSDQLRA